MYMSQLHIKVQSITEVTVNITNPVCLMHVVVTGSDETGLQYYHCLHYHVTWTFDLQPGAHNDTFSDIEGWIATYNFN